MLSLDLHDISLEGEGCGTWLSIPNSMSGKISFIELLSKMLSTDQIEWKYLTNELHESWFSK